MTAAVRKYSAAGTHHLADGTENQDALVSSENERYTAIVLADGVSSCIRAGDGARFAARITAEYIMKNADRLFLWSSEWVCEAVADEVCRKLTEYAAERGGRPEDYSSTLAFVLIDRQAQKAVCLSLGDGIILSSSQKQCRIELQPCIIHNGCYVTTTEGVERVMRCRIIETDDIDSISICSDGAWRAMYRRTKMRDDIRLAFMRNDMDYIFGCLDEGSLYDDHSLIFTPLHNAP